MQPAQRDAWNRVLSAIVLGGGVGAGARGLVGLRNLILNPPAVDEQSSVPSEVPIVVPRSPEEKRAFPEMPTRADGGVNFWEYPVGIGGGALGVYGGWKLVDWLMNQRNKARRQSELQHAEQEYESALKDQYSAMMMGKSAEASLDDVFDEYTQMRSGREKQAIDFNTIGRGVRDLGHGSLGAYLTALAALTGLSGVGMYNWTKSRSNAKAVERAIKMRRQQRQQPQPIMAYPKYEDAAA